MIKISISTANLKQDDHSWDPINSYNKIRNLSNSKHHNNWPFSTTATTKTVAHKTRRENNYIIMMLPFHITKNKTFRINFPAVLERVITVSEVKKFNFLKIFKTKILYILTNSNVNCSVNEFRTFPHKETNNCCWF